MTHDFEVKTRHWDIMSKKHKICILWHHIHYLNVSLKIVFYVMVLKTQVTYFQSDIPSSIINIEYHYDIESALISHLIYLCTLNTQNLPT